MSIYSAQEVYFLDCDDVAAHTSFHGGSIRIQPGNTFVALLQTNLYYDLNTEPPR